MWESNRTYLADPSHVLQARDTALVVAGRGINVMHRGDDGAWRYAIAVLSMRGGHDQRQGEDHDFGEQSCSETTARTAVGADEGEARWWFGSLAVIKATAAQTGGQMAIIEITEPPGAEAPLHVHHREDEGFWLLEGSATFEVGDTTIEAHAGD